MGVAQLHLRETPEPFFYGQQRHGFLGPFDHLFIQFHVHGNLLFRHGCIRGRLLSQAKGRIDLLSGPVLSTLELKKLCPRCKRHFPLDQRACEGCGAPLVVPTLGPGGRKRRTAELSGLLIADKYRLLESIGAGGFGALIGWYVYYINRYRTGDVQFSDLVTLVGVLGGGSVLALFPARTDLFGAYGIGLFAGFFGYFLILVAWVGASPNFDIDWFLDGRRKAPGKDYVIPEGTRATAAAMGRRQDPERSGSGRDAGVDDEANPLG